MLGEDEVAEIARAGYAEADSTDRKSREAAVSLFLSDAILEAREPDSGVNGREPNWSDSGRRHLTRGGISERSRCSCAI
jgi:hypothetical protein